jgi:hypothetical protein
MNRRLRCALLFLLSVTAAIATQLRVGTLNCYLLFDPAGDHPGKLDEKERMTVEQYREKITNLASLVSGCQIVALEETGGKSEIEALAKETHMEWAWSRGKDTATGEEVGVLYHLPGWKAVSEGRISDLDLVVSKHLLVKLTHGTETLYFLAVHLIRPIGAQEAKQARQIAAISAWASTVKDRDPSATILVVGDTNNSVIKKGSSLYGIGSEANELDQFASTHLTGKCFDRLVLIGRGHWKSIEVKRPPYGKRPNNRLKRVWTDHFFVGAAMSTD